MNEKWPEATNVLCEAALAFNYALGPVFLNYPRDLKPLENYPGCYICRIAAEDARAAGITVSEASRKVSEVFLDELQESEVELAIAKASGILVFRKK